MVGIISSSKVGVYVDAENLRLNGGFGMQYDVLREFACRDGAEAARLNVYVAYDEDRAAKCEHVPPEDLRIALKKSERIAGEMVHVR